MWNFLLRLFVTFAIAPALAYIFFIISFLYGNSTLWRNLFLYTFFSFSLALAKLDRENLSSSLRRKFRNRSRCSLHVIIHLNALAIGNLICHFKYFLCFYTYLGEFLLLVHLCSESSVFYLLLKSFLLLHNLTVFFNVLIN